MAKSIYAVTTIIGTIIGVGFFSLPYISSQVGIPLMLLYFLVLGILVTYIHLFFGEVALKTPDFKRLPGFARIHLGLWAEKLAIFTTILGFFGTILAYLIVGGGFLSDLLSPYLGGSTSLYVILFLALGSILILRGIRMIAKVEFFGVVLLLSVLALIFFKERSFIDFANISGAMAFKPGNWFLPYGPILFALWGTSIIPEAEEMIMDRKHLLGRTIVSSLLVVILVYLLFIFLVIGVSGSKVTPSALGGLASAMDGKAVHLVFLFGLLATFNAFISAGLTLKKSLIYDLKMNWGWAWGLTCFVPLILFFLGFNNFITLISFVGAVMLGIDGILILLMYHKINEKNILVYPWLLIFVVGIIYEIIRFFK
jgi:amino acid permease